ncbi:MAG: NAD(+)/NADH kinase [Lachnospiraceae bacterium]|nr:NAD(+)/NADH kinase [Lachnospiraceae bacterium]
MKEFLIFTNKHKDPELTVTRRIEHYLNAHGAGVSVHVLQSDWKRTEDSGDFVFPPKVECVLVLGGDGTVLKAARQMMDEQVPIIGVNLGSLGYMTEIDLECLEESLDKLLQDEYETECRMMLEGCVQFADGAFQKGHCLNDIVISRIGSLQIMKFNIWVNGRFLNEYSGDGMIVTTPTGSTGYNLSAGGPIVEPGARMIMLTPICPHTLNQRSIILSPEDVIEIQIPEGKEGQKQQMEVTFDGNHKVQVTTGDKIRVVQSDKVTEFIKVSQVSFLDVLHKKLSEKA